MNIPSHSWLFGKLPAEVVILAGVHGNETANVETIKELINSDLIKNNKHNILFIIGNPGALDKKVRYMETDLNREFNVFSDSYEGQRAKEIAPFLEKAKLLIDLHLTQIPTLKPFCVSSNHTKSMDFLSKLNVPIVDVVITEQFNPNSMSTDEYFLHHNPEGISLCLELGSIFDDKEKIISLGKQAITEALNLFNNLEERPSKKLFFWKEVQKVPNKPTVKLVPDLCNFLDIKKGQVLAYDESSPITSEQNGKCLFPKYAKTTDSYLLRIISKQSI